LVQTSGQCYWPYIVNGGSDFVHAVLIWQYLSSYFSVITNSSVMIFCTYVGEGLLHLLTLIHLFAWESFFFFNISFQRTTLNKNVLKIHQSKINVGKYKKILTFFWDKYHKYRARHFFDK
jgi:hypothetical protein